MLPCHLVPDETFFVPTGEVVLDGSCKRSITGWSSMSPVTRSKQYRVLLLWAVLPGQVIHVQDVLLLDCFNKLKAGSRIPGSDGPDGFSPFVATFFSVG